MLYERTQVPCVPGMVPMILPSGLANPLLLQGVVLEPMRLAVGPILELAM